MNAITLCGYIIQYYIALVYRQKLSGLKVALHTGQVQHGSWLLSALMQVTKQKIHACNAY